MVRRGGPAPPAPAGPRPPASPTSPPRPAHPPPPPTNTHVHLTGLGGHQLQAAFSKFPHVAGVYAASEPDRIRRLLSTLDGELEDRKERFALAGAASPAGYRRAAGGGQGGPAAGPGPLRAAAGPRIREPQAAGRGSGGLAHQGISGSPAGLAARSREEDEPGLERTAAFGGAAPRPRGCPWRRRPRSFPGP